MKVKGDLSYVKAILNAEISTAKVIGQYDIAQSLNWIGTTLMSGTVKDYELDVMLDIAGNHTMLKNEIERLVLPKWVRMFNKVLG